MLNIHGSKRTLRRLFVHISQTPLLLTMLVLRGGTEAALYMAVYMQRSEKEQ
jgi:hypothetical protein